MDLVYHSRRATVRSRFVRLLAPLLSLFVAVGCSDARAEAPAPALTGDTILVISDDPELRALAAELLPELAERSGMRLSEPVRVVRRSRSELEGFLRHKLDEEFTPERERGLRAAYGLLGLVPEGTDLRALLMSVYMEQVAGFYDPDSTALFVLDDQPAATLRPLLLHELVHAVQDQNADLAAITAPEVGNDRRAAAQAAIEGHATLVMLEQMTEELQGRPVDLEEIPDFAGRIRPLLEGARNQYPALASAPRVIQESLLLPYLEGAGFVQRLWQASDGRPAPFGELLPASTEQILDAGRFLADPPDRPVEVRVEAEGVEVLHTDVLGRAETIVLLEEHTDGDGRAATEGWGGDRYLAFERAGAEGLVWASVWDDAGARDRFVEALRPGLGSFPAAAALETREIDGRPGAVLRIGARAPFTVSATLSAGPDGA